MRRRVRNPFKGYEGLPENECLLPPYSLEPDFHDGYRQPDSSQSDVIVEVRFSLRLLHTVHLPFQKSRGFGPL